MANKPLTIALSKGRILKETLPLLEAAGIRLLEDPESSRKLIFDTSRDDVKIIIIRATDVPPYLQYGGADIGVAGKDVLMEHGADGIYEPLDLEIARCKLMVAAKKDAPAVNGRLRVATKFVNIARRYFASQGVQAEVIKLYGAMELAPLVGLADRIVDVQEAQAEGQQEFRSALEQFRSVIDVEGGELEKQYNKLQSAYDDSEAAAEKITDRADCTDFQPSDR